MPDLLPPNATRYERAVDAAIARAGDVPIPLQTLWNPATCPPELLPWLAWALSIDRWSPDWTTAEKRHEVARSIEMQRHKGTPRSIDQVLESFDALLTLTEWFEQSPPAPIHSFNVTLPLDAAGGDRATAAFASAIVRDINRIKPLRSHMEFVQELRAEASMFLVGAGRVAGETRIRASLYAGDPSVPWEDLLQTETGEPLQLDDGSFIENDT